MQKILGILAVTVLLVACKKSKDKTEVPTAIVSDREEVMLLGFANQEDSFRITTNRSWKITVEPAANWLQLNASAGRGDFTIKMKHLNDATQEAKVTLTISDVTKQVADKKVVINRQPFYVAPAVKMVGGSKEDVFNKAYATSDGGFIVVGTTKSYDGDMSFRQGPEVNFSDGLVIKFSANGNIEWKKAYGGNSEDVFNTVIEMPGAGFILAGHSFSNDGDFASQHGFGDTWIMKIDYDGNKVWSKLFGGNSADRINSVFVTGANEIIAVGQSQSDDGDFAGLKGNTNQAGLWMKISSNGVLNTVKGVGSAASIYYSLKCITQSPSGSFLVSGSYNGGVLSDIWQVNVDPGGSTTSDKTFQSGYITSHINSADNGGLLAGFVQGTGNRDIISKFGFNDGLLLRTSQDGSKRWYQQYGGSKNDQFNSIVRIPSIGYLMVGNTASNDHQVKDYKGGIADGWAVLVDEAGKLLWSKTIGGTLEENISDVILLNNKRIVCVGSSRSTDGDMRSQGENDGYVLVFE